MTSFLPPTILFLRSFLSHQVSLTSEQNFHKAVRCYIYVKALYNSGGCRVNNSNYYIQFISETNSFTPSDFLNNCVKSFKNAENNPLKQTPLELNGNDSTILQKFKAKDLLFLNSQDEQSWKESFKKYYHELNNTKIENLLNSFPFNKDSIQKLTCINFRKTLADKQWIIPLDKKNGIYSKIEPEKLEEKLKPYQDTVSSATKEETGDFFPNEFINKFIRKFSPVNDTRILFESECLVSDNIPLAQIDTIIDTLAQNWFNGSQINPIQLSYKEKETQKVITVITYPVTFVYIKRTFYLYGIESERDDWQAYRIDRINSAKILDWNDPKVPETLKTLLDEDDLPTIDEIQDELENNALGYAFWKTPKIMLLQFEKHHYNLHIKNNQRSQIFREINLNNFEKVYKPASNILSSTDKQKTKQQIMSILKKASRNSLDNKYVFCLATYYEQEIAVLQRLLAWGQKVKVIFPETLQQEILEELHSTLRLYESNL